MLKDGFGLEVATEQPAVIAGIDAFSDAFQGQRQGVVGIFQAAKAESSRPATNGLFADPTGIALCRTAHSPPPL